MSWRSHGYSIIFGQPNCVPFHLPSITITISSKLLICLNLDSRAVEIPLRHPNANWFRTLPSSWYLVLAHLFLASFCSIPLCYIIVGTRLNLLAEMDNSITLKSLGSLILLCSLVWLSCLWSLKYILSLIHNMKISATQNEKKVKENPELEKVLMYSLCSYYK